MFTKTFFDKASVTGSLINFKARIQLKKWHFYVWVIHGSMLSGLTNKQKHPSKIDQVKLFGNERNRTWQSINLGVKICARSNMRKMEGLFNDINKVGTAVPKNTTLHYNELKSCSTCKVPLLKMACVQAHLKFASEQLNDSEKAWETVLRSEETKIKLSGTNSIHCV